MTPWKYKGDSKYEGSGKHGQRSPSPGDLAFWTAVQSAANAATLVWPDASRNLLHYLYNSGNPMDVNVDSMLIELPELRTGVQGDIDRMTKAAVDDAKASGASGPVTYPFSTEWKDQTASNKNWFYALGSYQYATEGTVTVYPPTPDTPEWTYSYEYRVHVADRYNWDEGKATKFFGVVITDEQMQALHEAGIAQEYDVTGESSVMGGAGP